MTSHKERAGRAYVKYKGQYNWDLLYKTIWNWLVQREYETQDKRYKVKKTVDGGELKVDITGEVRQTAYTKLHMKIKIRAWDLREKVVKVDGHTKLLTGGRILIEIVGDVELDWQKIFSNSKFHQILQGLYEWIKKKELEQIIIDDHEYEVLRLETEIKKVLNMDASFMAFENSN